MAELPQSIDRPRLRASVWTAALAVTIFFASGNSEVAAPGGIPFVDKIGHFAVFGLLGTLLVRILHWPSHQVKTVIVTTLIVSVYGLVDETRQSFTPGRSVEFLDWVADSSGALVACLLYCYVPIWRRTLEWKPGRGESKKSVQENPVLPPPVGAEAGVKK